MFHARYHEASKVIQKEADKVAAEDAANKKRKSEEAHDDFKWAQATETALGNLMPKMKAAIAKAELIESEKRTLTLKDKFHAAQAVEEQYRLQNEAIKAAASLEATSKEEADAEMTESGARK